MFTRLLAAPLRANKSFFLFGPRGTGKTSWVKTTFPNALYLDLLDSGLFTDLQARPERLEVLIPKNYAGWIIIDEVQKIPELLNEVHRLIEASTISLSSLDLRQEACENEGSTY
jgi:predicted AAA+ superfamily ATPase